MISGLAAEIAKEAGRLACNWQGKDVLQRLLEYDQADGKSQRSTFEKFSCE